MFRRYVFPGMFIALIVAVGATLVAPRESGTATASSDSVITGSVTGTVKMTGPSGLPLPRFVSLKTARVNVRRGPSTTHQVAWVFARKGLPVEVIAEFDLWRRVRDSEGDEGWVYHSLLAGKRTALVAPWRKGQRVTLLDAAHSQARPVAAVDAGVQGVVERCDGAWCQFTTNGYTGWLPQNYLWGVYPGEVLG